MTESGKPSSTQEGGEHAARRSRRTRWSSRAGHSWSRLASERQDVTLADRTWRAAPIGDYRPDGDLPIALTERYLMARQRPALDQELAASADTIFAMAASVVKERGAEFFVLFLVRADECEAGAFLFDLDQP